MLSSDTLSLINHKIGFDAQSSIKLFKDYLSKADDGELFIEFRQSESFVFDDGRIKSSGFDSSQGFGLRSVVEDVSAYAHSSIITPERIKNAAKNVSAISKGYSGSVNLDSGFKFGIEQKLYTDRNPTEEGSFADKIALLESIDSYLRKNNHVKQVSASLAGEWQLVAIIKADGNIAVDTRPLVRLNIGVVVERDGKMERGSAGKGGRAEYAKFITTESWQDLADKALNQAMVNLEAIPAPAGEMTVVVGSGWPGVLLHEAVGHGLEGDFNRKKTSVFSEMMGKQVAAKGVTVVDNGTIEARRGSLSVDDEGTPTQHNILIEDGILKGYMQDRMNARLMKVLPTGNGRRESYAHQPMPRMTNTYMLAGKDSPEDIIASVKRGIYAPYFGGGQVDITSGKFVFSASEAYMIENGKITSPIKGATLIGSGADALTKIRAIGNDMNLDDGIGTCGKAGQSVPVGVGQPTLLIDSMTVGGTES